MGISNKYIINYYFYTYIVVFVLNSECALLMGIQKEFWELVTGIVRTQMGIQIATVQTKLSNSTSTSYTKPPGNVLSPGYRVRSTDIRREASGGVYVRK